MDGWMGGERVRVALQAQGSTIQGVTVFARDGFAGIAGGSGSGGSHVAVTVVGGRYGVDYRETQPASTMAGFKLVNQACGGILYCGLMAGDSSKFHHPKLSLFKHQKKKRCTTAFRAIKSSERTSTRV
jgi:hypothetical protein